MLPGDSKAIRRALAEGTTLGPSPSERREAWPSWDIRGQQAPLLPHHPSLHACFPALTKNSDWVDQFRVKFLGSVQVPYHKGNDVLCAAMQKVPGARPPPGPPPLLGRQTPSA